MKPAFLLIIWTLLGVPVSAHAGDSAEQIEVVVTITRTKNEPDARYVYTARYPASGSYVEQSGRAAVFAEFAQLEIRYPLEPERNTTLEPIGLPLYSFEEKGSDTSTAFPTSSTGRLYGIGFGEVTHPIALDVGVAALSKPEAGSPISVDDFPEVPGAPLERSTLAHTFGRGYVFIDLDVDATIVTRLVPEPERACAIGLVVIAFAARARRRPRRSSSSS